MYPRMMSLDKYLTFAPLCLIYCDFQEASSRLYETFKDILISHGQETVTIISI